MNRILIVEDEITISRLIAVSLRRAGYDCTVANDGSTAADLIAEHDLTWPCWILCCPAWTVMHCWNVCGLRACRSSLSRPKAR